MRTITESRDGDGSWETLAEIANYSPGALARYMRVSTRTLQRHFARKYGLKLGVFLARLRMEKALTLLNAGQSVKAASYGLGFKQVSHFSRAFKGFHGAPPSLWKLNPLNQVKLCADGLVFPPLAAAGHLCPASPSIGITPSLEINVAY